jgi:hypothetical protein
MVRFLLMFALGLVSAPAHAVTLLWPTGAAPCNNIASLQACVNAAASGDVIEIAANAIPAQSVSIPASGNPPKSLTLRPAAGFTPTFADFSSIFAAGGDVDVTIVIEGITIARGAIRARQGGEGTFRVTFRGNRVLDTTSFGAAFEVSSGNTQPPYGPTLFQIEQNQIDISVDPTDQVSGISVGGFQGGTNVGTIVGNTIHQVGGGQNGAIDIANGDVTLQVDVIGNQISGSNFNEGVGIFQFAPNGTVVARIINNAISGQVDAAGAPAAISLNVSQGTATFTVVNNTAAYNDGGLLLGGRADLGASIAAVIANNVFAFNENGVNIDPDFSSVVNEFNVVFGNGSNFYAPGPGTLFSDPLLVGPANFRLRKGSPARDAGRNSRVPPDITTDVVGAARIHDGVVDIGAFEDGDDYLLLNNQCNGSTAHLPVALANLGISFVETTTPTDFGSALASGTSWDLVLVDAYNDALSAATNAAIRDYIANGGRIYMNDWNLDAQTALSLGAVLGTGLTQPPTFSRWDPDHPLFVDPNAVGDAAPNANTCGRDASQLEPSPGALAIGGYSAAPAPNEAGLIVANGGRTVLLGTTPGLYPAAQMVPLLENVILFLLSPDILLLDGQCGGSASYFPQALGDLGLEFKQTSTGDAFDAWLASGKDFRLVIVDSYDEAPVDRAALQAYVQGGGRAWWNSADTDATTASVFEATLGAAYSAPRALRRWFGACCGPNHPVYRAPGVGKLQTPALDTCGTDGFELGLAGQGVALAGYTSVPTPGQAALVAGNHGRTLLFGATGGLYPAGEMLPLLRGALRFLLSGYPLYSTESSGSTLRSVDPATGVTQSGVGIALSGAPIEGAPGLAMNPLTGELWAVATTDSGRDLVRLNPDTGAATRIGSPGRQLAGLAFDCRGTLYGVTGENDAVAPESLFTLSTQSGAAALVTALGNGDGGEALAFSPADGLLHHGSGSTTQVLETIDPTSLGITPVPLSGDVFSEFRGLTYAADPDRLLLSDGFALFGVTPAGVVSRIGALDHFAKGLASTDVRCCADPGDADCDGRANAVDLCPFYIEQNPAADVDGNGRGNECECGDQNGDGRVNISDIVAINVAIFNPPLVTPLCDTNGDGLCNIVDIVGANVEIFSPGSTSICSRQPVPGP